MTAQIRLSADDVMGINNGHVIAVLDSEGRDVNVMHYHERESFDPGGIVICVSTNEMLMLLSGMTGRLRASTGESFDVTEAVAR